MCRHEIDLEFNALRDDAAPLEGYEFTEGLFSNIGVKQVLEPHLRRIQARSKPVAETGRACRVNAKQLVRSFECWIVGKRRLQPSDPVRAIACFAIGNAIQIRAQCGAYGTEYFAAIGKRHTPDEMNMTH